MTVEVEKSEVVLSSSTLGILGVATVISVVGTLEGALEGNKPVGNGQIVSGCCQSLDKDHFIISKHDIILSWGNAPP